MKKLLALLIAVIMCVSLFACGNNEVKEEQKDSAAAESDTVEKVEEPEEVLMTKEEMLKVAEAVDIKDINNDTLDNIARAKQLYCGKTLLLSGFISEINEDHVVLSTTTSVKVKVYLPIEELIDPIMEDGLKITCVGQTSDDISTETSMAAGYEFEHRMYSMENAYFVSATTEKEIVLHYNPSLYELMDEINYSVGDSNVWYTITFADSVDVTTLPSEETEMTVSGKIYSDGDIVDAVIVE
ncbi:MAG: hypothetical protein IJA55_03670 [Clostridia bacterium]|nr:hypothetical protein [Clostridia bacterium]